MWLPETRRRAGILLRFAAAMAIAGAVGGCFQPLYGARSPTGGPAVSEALASIEIEPITAPNGTALARLAVEVQNELRFGFTGGSGSTPFTRRLTIKLIQNGSSVIIDRTTGRAEFSNYGLDAAFTLTDLATRKPLVAGSAVARVSYDIPGQEQRFAADRGRRDAETRAAKLIAEQIRTRLASFFAAGT